MEQTPRQGDFFVDVDAPDGTSFVNARCLMRTQDGHRLVIVSGVVIAQYALGERMAEAHAMVSLIDQGWADQKDVARAFGCSARSVRRHQRRFEDGGLPALGRDRGYPKGHPRLPASRKSQVTRLKGQGFSNCQIAMRMGVTEKAIRNILRRMGWTKPEQTQATLPLASEGASPNVSGSSITRPDLPLPPASDPKLSAFVSSDLPLVPSMDNDPSDRRFDRLMAYLGLLDDAAPLFRPGMAIPGAGVLLAMPALVASGVIECAREVYGNIGPAFFGLRTTIVSLVLMALLRIKRSEGLKERPQWNVLDGQLRQARATLKTLPAEYGLKALLNPESRRPTMRGFKIAPGKLGQKILEAVKRCRELEIQRAAVPPRLPVGQVVSGPVIKLATERIHLTSRLKMIAYQVESDLFRQITPHYQRAEDEGRTLIQSVLASAADIEVSKTELRVLVAPLSSPHRTRVLATLCGELNATATKFPGTNLILRYDVAEIRK